MNLLSIKNLTISYENKIAVDNISFDVKHGDYLCILGENGSGKSSLLKSILGLCKIKSGEIIFNDGLAQNEIGYLPQQTLVQKDFPASVCEVVLSGCLNKRGFRPFYSKTEKNKATKTMEKLSIENIRNMSYRDLSGGQQQRVLLARALCATKKLIVLDEPVTGLDPLITSEFYSLIKKLNTQDGITIIMVSHDVKSALSQGNTILHMGTAISFYGSVNEYKNSHVSDGFMEGAVS